MKQLSLLFFFLFSFFTSGAQKFFGRAAVGYGFPLSNSRPVYITGFPYTGGSPDPTDNAMFEIKKASMFSGIRGTAAVGYMFPKLGFEVAVSSVLSEVSHSFSQSLAIYPAGTTTTVTQSAKYPTLLIPALVMKVPGRTLDVLLRAGIALPVNKKIFIDGETKSDSVNFSDHSELRTRFGIGLAFSGGAEYKITKDLRAFITIDILVMTLKATELKLISATANGQDVTASRYPYQRSTLYVEDPTAYTFDQNQPRQAQAYSVPFGTKGFSIGIFYQL
jgi:hypothetical protein